MSNKKKPVGMAFDITTGKSYKVYQPEAEMITLILTREQAEQIRLWMIEVLKDPFFERPIAFELKKQIEEKLK